MKKKIISILKIVGYILIIFITSIILATSISNIIGFIFAIVAIWIFPLNTEAVFINRFNNFKDRKGRIVATLIALLLLIETPTADFIVLNSDIGVTQSGSITSYILQYKTHNIKTPILNGDKINSCPKDICSIEIKLEHPITNINIIDDDNKEKQINYIHGDKPIGFIKIKREKNITEIQEEEKAVKIAKEQELLKQEQEKIEQAKKDEENKKRIVEEEKLKKEQADKDRILQENRPKINESCFSAWDGVHINGEMILKKSLNDPDSYKHDETRYSNNGKVVIKFRAKNGFGGYIISYMTFQTNADCAVDNVNIE